MQPNGVNKLTCSPADTLTHEPHYMHTTSGVVYTIVSHTLAEQ